jgi:20S proteasome alpha/beta subunit
MSIAAGFVHRGGVLLCADTELTAGIRKLQASKIFHFESALGRFAFAFAGNVRNAVATLQKVEAKVNRSRRNAMSVVEHVLDIEYKRLVLCQPSQFHDVHDFSLIIAYKPPKGSVEMYRTDATAISREKFHTTVGIGSSFADQLIDANILSVGSSALASCPGPYAS